VDRSLRLCRIGGAGVEAAGVQPADAPVGGVCACGATSLFDGVMVGLGGAQTGCVDVVGWKSLTLGTGLIDLSLLFTQLNCRGLSGVTSGVV
jgi:hypothetical protein